MSFITRFFSRSLRSKTSAEFPCAASEDTEAVVRAYGNVLEHSAPAPGCVADASRLPYPKETIEEALLAALRLSDDSTFKAHLRVAFLNLSQWHDGVGPVNQGLDLTRFSPDEIAKLSPNEILEMAPQNEQWTPVVQADLDRLARKLKETGLWE